MKIGTYNPVDMSLVTDDATGISFGNTIRGGYSPSPVVIKPEATTEGSFTKLALFLEDNAGLSSTSFRYLKSAVAIEGIGSGSASLSNHFTEVAGVEDFSSYSNISGYGASLDASAPEFIWLDCKVGVNASVGSAAVNYRFIFEYA